MSTVFRQNALNDRFRDPNDTLYAIQIRRYLVYLPTEVRYRNLQRVLIVEDDPAQLQVLKNSIQEKYAYWRIDTADSYDVAMELIEQSLTTDKPFTLFLLDIQLSKEKGDRGGFLIAEAIRSQKVYFTVPILFLTAVSDQGMYALSHFHCYNYISKPYTSEAIIFQIEQMLFTGLLDNNFVFTDTNRIQHKLSARDILLAETQSHTLTIYTEEASYTTREYSLEQLSDTLGSPFVRCHKRFLVNGNLIENYDRVTKCINIGSHCIPVGRAYLEVLKNYI